MGFTSVLVVNNDLLSYDRDKNFGAVWNAAETDANCKRLDIKARTGLCCVEMAWNEHSDIFGLLMVGSTQAKVLTTTANTGHGPVDYNKIELDLLKRLADKHSFNLHKKPATKRSKKGNK